MDTFQSTGLYSDTFNFPRLTVADGAQYARWPQSFKRATTIGGTTALSATIGAPHRSGRRQVSRWYRIVRTAVVILAWGRSRPVAGADADCEVQQ